MAVWNQLLKPVGRPRMGKILFSLFDEISKGVPFHFRRKHFLKTQRGYPYHIYLPRTLSREWSNAPGDGHVTANTHLKNESLMVTPVDVGVGESVRDRSAETIMVTIRNFGFR